MERFVISIRSISFSRETAVPASQMPVSMVGSVLGPAAHPQEI